MDRRDAKTRDSNDPLRRFRRQFKFKPAYCQFIDAARLNFISAVLGHPDMIYLDGNSLGRQPKAARKRAREIMDQWAYRLINGWEDWLTLPQRIGDKIGIHLLGAKEGETIVTDNTTINLYKLVNAATESGTRVIVTNDQNFPTDSYVFEGVAKSEGVELKVFECEDPLNGPSVEDVGKALEEVLKGGVKGEEIIVSLPHVDYKTGAKADMAGINRRIRSVGAKSLWDLCHSAGEGPIDLEESETDFAAGCTYKYLNGGPGSNAFLYVRSEHHHLVQPIWGWFGHARQFEFDSGYVPAEGIKRHLTGTTQVMSTALVEPGIDILIDAGIENLREKGRRLGEYMVQLYEKCLRKYGFELASPRDPNKRGSHISLAHENGYQITQALVSGNVIPDFRPPENIRFGLVPIYTRFRDVFDGMMKLVSIMEERLYRDFPEKPAQGVVP